MHLFRDVSGVASIRMILSYLQSLIQRVRFAFLHPYLLKEALASNPFLTISSSHCACMLLVHLFSSKLILRSVQVVASSCSFIFRPYIVIIIDIIILLNIQIIIYRTQKSNIHSFFYLLFLALPRLIVLISIREVTYSVKRS